MLYALLQLLALSLPGLLLISLLGIRHDRYLFVIALSYAYYAFIAGLAIWQHWTTAVVMMLYLSGLLTLLVVVVIRHILNVRLKLSTASLVSLPRAVHLDQADRAPFFTGIGIVMLYSVYRYWAGPYLELPADVYHHLEYARGQFNLIETGYLNQQHSLTSMLGQRGGIWYSLFAWLASMTSTDFTEALPQAMYVNGVVFLLAVYAFSLALFRQLSLSPTERIIVAVLATFFVAAHMGINVMSYLRYYTFAPTMLNMVLYFAGLICVFKLMEPAVHYGQSFKLALDRLLYLGLFAVFGLAAALIHTQEALFLIAMTLFILVIHFLSRAFSRSPGRKGDASHQRLFLTWSTLFLVLGLVGVIGAEVWVYTHNVRPTELFGKVLQLSQSGSIASRIFYLNPEFQFIRVVTVWGLLVFALFIWQFRAFKDSPFIVAGMVSPLLTVFNPIFVDFFLRLDGPHTVWRMLYAVPLHFVAAYLCLIFYRRIRDRGYGLRQWPHAMALVFLFVLLLPINLGSVSNAYARLTLAPVDEQNDYTHWQDLFDFLNHNQPTRSILTDPVTGYAIQGLTPHYTYRYKFLPIRAYKRYQFDFDDYTDEPLRTYSGWWLIVNDREGAHSVTGEMARHWSADIMKTSKYYGTALRSQLQANPDRFKVIWSKKQITVYEISS